MGRISNEQLNVRMHTINSIMRFRQMNIDHVLAELPGSENRSYWRNLLVNIVALKHGTSITKSITAIPAPILGVTPDVLLSTTVWTPPENAAEFDGTDREATPSGSRDNAPAESTNGDGSHEAHGLLEELQSMLLKITKTGVVTERIAQFIAEEDDEVPVIQAALDGIANDEEPPASLNLGKRLIEEYRLNPKEYPLASAETNEDGTPQKRKRRKKRKKAKVNTKAKTTAKQEPAAASALPIDQTIAPMLAGLPINWREHSPEIVVPEYVMLRILLKRKGQDIPAPAAALAEAESMTLDRALACKLAATGAAIESRGEEYFVRVPARLLVERLWKEATTKD